MKRLILAVVSLVSIVPSIASGSRPIDLPSRPSAGLPRARPNGSTMTNRPAFLGSTASSHPLPPARPAPAAHPPTSSHAVPSSNSRGFGRSSSYATTHASEFSGASHYMMVAKDHRVSRVQLSVSGGHPTESHDWGGRLIIERPDVKVGNGTGATIRQPHPQVINVTAVVDTKTGSPVKRSTSVVLPDGRIAQYHPRSAMAPRDAAMSAHAYSSTLSNVRRDPSFPPPPGPHAPPSAYRYVPSATGR